MKKITALSIALALALSLSACGGNGGGSGEADVSVTASSAEIVKDETEKEKMTDESKTEDTESVSETSEETSSSSITEQLKNRVELDMSNIKEFPTGKYGSEIACATLFLNYLGFDATEEALLTHMSIMEKPNEDGTWDTPYIYYLGVPGESSYGCYNAVVTDTIKAYFLENNINEYKALWYHYDNTSEIQSIIDNNFPLIIWATKNMKSDNPKEILIRDDYEEIEWITETQCFLIIGYEEETKNFILFDPYSENQIVEYSYDDVLAVMSEFNNQIVEMEKNE